MPVLDWSLVVILSTACGPQSPSIPTSVALAEPIPAATVAPPSGDPDPPTPSVDGPRGRGEADRPLVRGEFRGDGRPGGQRRPLSPEQIDAIVAVAVEVFPDGGARLRELRERDPEALERVLGRQARRLFALAMLRDRNPELYALKLEELRNQMELRTLAARHAALGAEQVEDTEAASERGRIEARIREIAEQQVDLGLRVRGLELAAMDEAIRRMRTELAEDAGNRDVAIDEMVEVVLSGREPPSREWMPERGRRSSWGGRGAGGRLDRDEDGDGPRRRR